MLEGVAFFMLFFCLTSFHYPMDFWLFTSVSYTKAS